MKNTELAPQPSRTELFDLPSEQLVANPELEIVSPDCDFLKHHKTLAEAGEITERQATKISDYMRRLQQDSLSEKEKQSLGDLCDINFIAEYYLSLGPTSRIKNFDHPKRGFRAMPFLIDEAPKSVFAKTRRGQYVPQNPRSAALAGIMYYEASKYGEESLRAGYQAMAEGILLAVRTSYAESAFTGYSDDELHERQGMFTDNLAENSAKKILYNLSFDNLRAIEEPYERKTAIEKRIRKLLIEDTEKEQATGFKYELLVFALANLIILESGNEDRYRVHFATPRQDTSSMNSGHGNHRFNHDLILQVQTEEGWTDLQRIDIKSHSKKVMGKHQSISVMQSEQTGSTVSATLEEAQRFLMDGNAGELFINEVERIKSAMSGSQFVPKIIDITK